MNVSLVPEFFYDFCLGREVTLAGQSHRDLSARPSTHSPLPSSSAYAQRSRLIFVSPVNDVFAKHYFYAALSRFPLFSPCRRLGFCRDSHAPDTTRAAGHLPRVTCPKGLLRLRLKKTSLNLAKRMHVTSCGNRESSRTPRHNIPD